MPQFSLRPEIDSPVELERQLDALRAALTGAEPEGLAIGGSLVLPDDETPRWTGTATPVVGRRLAERPSGLIVPFEHASPPAPIDAMSTYMTAEDLFGGPMDWDQVVRFITGIPVKDLLAAVGRFMVHLRKMGPTREALHLELVDAFCTGPTKPLAAGLVKEGRLFLAPQLLLGVAKLGLLLRDPDRPTIEGDPMVHAITAQLGLACFVGAPDDHGTSTWGDIPEALALELVSNQEFNRSCEPGALIGHFHSLWRDLPHRRDSKIAAAHEAAFLERTGVTIEQAFTVGFLFWVHAMQQDLGHFGPGFFDSVVKEADKAAVDLYVTDIDVAQALVAAEVEELGFDWSANSFRRFPLIRHHDGSMTLTDPDFLLARACGTAAHWELNAHYDGTKAWGGFRSFRGLVAEDNVEASLRASVGEVEGGARRLWTEEELRSLWPGVKVCDFVVDFGFAFVCIEVVSRSLSARSANGKSTEDLDRDLRLIVEDKAVQLDSTVRQILRDESVLTGAPALPTRRILPVVVAVDGFPVSPITMSVIANRLAASGVLSHPRVGQLEILDLDVLEAIESIQDNGGPTLAEILSSKATAGLRLAAMDQYLYIEEHHRLRPPERVRADRDAVFQLALAYVRPPDGDSTEGDVAAA